MDDSLRHAITKLAHIHFPATQQSAQRLKKMGEDPWRIHCAGSPGIDGITKAAATPSQIRGAFPELRPQRFALVVFHPINADESLELHRAEILSAALKSSSIEKIVIIFPNSDPGAPGIIRHWQSLRADPRFIIHPDIPRPLFLGLLRDTAMLVGNSSSGIIEAASFHTPVIDIGPRQQGRERCKDVLNVPYRQSAIAAAVRQIWNSSHPLRGKHSSLYAQPNTGKRIAEALRKLEITPRLLRKIISY
jgi:UDP-hydrolysing UDP-N-acetyl-D-glucosamine 2-epimerase